MSDPFKQFLHDAEMSAAAPRASGVDFPTAVRQQVQRRQTIRRRSIGVVVVLLVASVALLDVRWPTHEIASAPSQPDPQMLKEQLAALDQTATLHALTAEKLLAMEHSRQVQQKLIAAERADPIRELQFQRDRAALTMIYQADRLVRQKEPRQAIAAYRRTIDLFPESRWAQVARRKLSEM